MCILLCHGSLNTCSVYTCNSTLSRLLQEWEHLQWALSPLPNFCSFTLINTLPNSTSDLGYLNTCLFSLAQLFAFGKQAKHFTPIFPPHDWTQGYTWGLWTLIIFHITGYKPWHMVCVVNIGSHQCLQAEFTRLGKIIIWNLFTPSCFVFCASLYQILHKKTRKSSKLYWSILTITWLICKIQAVIFHSFDTDSKANTFESDTLAGSGGPHL